MRFWLGAYTADAGGSASGIGMLTAGEAGDPSAGGPLAFTGDAVATGGGPSWLARHPSLDVVYAAMEAAGTVQAFRRRGTAHLAALGDPVEAGEAVCHVAVAPDGGSLVASCWGDGRVVRIALGADGRPGAPVVAAAAADPWGDADAGGGLASDGLALGGAETRPVDRDPGRPAGSRSESGVSETIGRRRGADAATGAATAGGGPGLLDLAAAAQALREAAGSEFAHLVPYGDLDPAASEGRGVSEGLMAFGGRFDPTAAPLAKTGAAAEPRVSRAHQAAHLPGGVIATTDLGYDLVRFWRARGAGLVLRQELALPRGTAPRHMRWHPSGHLYIVTELSHELYVLGADGSGTWHVVGGTSLGAAIPPDDTAAEVALSRDGETVYAGIRGSDAIAALRVRGDGSEVAPVALVDAGVHWPRHHFVVRDTLVVAGQLGDEVASLTLDLRTGIPGRVRHRATAPSPTCLLPVR